MTHRFSIYLGYLICVCTKCFGSLFEEFNNISNVQLTETCELPFIIRVFSPCVEVYGRGGSYNVFSGKDASRAIAKWSMSEEDLNDNLVRN